MIDISIIVATNNHKNLIRVLDYIERQSFSGFSSEIVIVQESSDGHNKFNIDTKLPINNMIIKRQPTHSDYGAAAHDTGIIESNGKYLVFWDDDNIYYQHALIAQYSAANGFDIGIVRTRHNNMVIPTTNQINAGDIDTMCLCVRKELAVREKWVTIDGGRYSDFRWLSKLLKYNPTINYSDIIIGHHL